jgi:hypothetical protein
MVENVTIWSLYSQLVPDDQSDYSRWPAAVIREFPEVVECFVLAGRRFFIANRDTRLRSL